MGDMHKGIPQNIMQESNNPNDPQRRRSARLSLPQENLTTDKNKMAPPAAFVKRRITVRKIVPRKTTLAPSEHNKENTLKRTVSEGIPERKLKVSTPDNVLDRKSSSGKKKKKATMPSPILPSPPPPLTAQSPVQVQSQQTAPDPDSAVWSQKVRRSYSRLGEKSFNSPDSRKTLFGFAKLQTPEVIGKGRENKTGLEMSGSFSTLDSFMSLLEAEACSAEPDRNIPGVIVVKEKRRRKKVQQISSSELDSLVAQMNAEFEEAEEFELVVE